MKKDKPLIRFDWAMKKLLKDKANFDILEGFLSELLSEDIHIKQILDGESNRDKKDDKHNRVDVLVENSKGELVIIEVQDSKEYDYFHRILYGTSKAIAEHIGKGKAYAQVKKVISITIAYFDLGQGEDYIYHGINEFKGIHKGDILLPAEEQKEKYGVDEVYKIYPEYWLIKVDQFDDVIKDKLDEWIYFLKNSAVKNDFSAKGLSEAMQKLDEMKLSKKDRTAYNHYLKDLMDIASAQHTVQVDIELAEKKGMQKGEEIGLQKGEEIGLQKGEEIGLQKGEEIRQQKEKDAVIRFHKMKMPVEDISSGLNISIEKVKAIIAEYEKNN